MIIGYKNNVPQKISIKRPCQGYYLRWYYNGWHYWFFYPGRISLITEGEKYRTIGTKSVMMGTGQITHEQCQAIRTILNTREVYILTSYGWRNVRIEPGSVGVYDNQVNGYEIELNVKIGSKEISITGFSPIADVPIIPISLLPVYVPPDGECIIGTQVWMTKNYDSNFPGSKVYNNDEANRSEYGGLYTYDQIMSPGFCPIGWHIPTVAEWTNLIGNVGNVTNAGGKLKEAGTIHWNTDNTLPPLSCFAAFGGGYDDLGSFNSLKIVGDFWTADLKSVSEAYIYRMWDNQTSIASSWWPRNRYKSVRLIKDTPAPIPILSMIPDTLWFYLDGTPYPSGNIINVTCDSLWSLIISGYGGIYTNKANGNGNDVVTVTVDPGFSASALGLITFSRTGVLDVICAINRTD